MSTSAQPQESVNPKSGMTQTEAKESVRNHFDEFVNRKHLDIGNVNFVRSLPIIARMFRRALRRDQPGRSNT